MSEAVIIGIISLIGGAGGVVALIKSVLDYRANRAARIEDADERLVARLERRLDEQEKRIEELEALRDADAQYIIMLTTMLAQAGIAVPKRKLPTLQRG